jgi:hypothetical protein
MEILYNKTMAVCEKHRKDEEEHETVDNAGASNEAVV